MTEYKDIKLNIPYVQTYNIGHDDVCFWIFTNVNNNEATYIEIDTWNEEDGPLVLKSAEQKDWEQNDDGADCHIKESSWEKIFAIISKHQLIHDAFDYDYPT